MHFKFLDREPIEMTQFMITPDRTADNKHVHDLFRAVSSFYASWYDILSGKKNNGAFWWDIMMKHDEIRFFCTVPKAWEREIHMHIENTWPLSSIEEVVNHTEIPMSSDVCEMKYRRNNIFALQTDRRIEYEPLNSILSIISEMKENDLARVCICAEPISRLDWQDYAERKHTEFQKGSTPKRTRLSKKEIFVSVGEMIINTLQSLFDTVDSAMSKEPIKKEQTDDLEKRWIMIDGQLSRGTVNKIRVPTFNTYIRIASHSSDQHRQQIILRTISNSFNDLTADNELERSDIHPKIKPSIIKELNTYRISWPTRLDFDKNKMSNEELSRLVELPTAGLQDMYADELPTLSGRQIEVPTALTEGGIPIGEVSFKKESVPVYMPVKDWDQLCLPTCVIGGMGSGKTKGFGCQRAIGYVQCGYNAVIFDPAKSEVWQQIEAGLPKEKRKRILLGKEVISLDFREAMRSPAARGRLAQIILAFFDDNSDAAGAQTQRFLRAAVMGMRTGKLKEIMDIFTDGAYRKTIIQGLKEGMHKTTLMEFDGYKPDRQRQILAPIMNRLDIILGDPYLEKCMNADRGIDMIDVLSEKNMCTVFDIPDRLNTREAKDILINLLSFKIDAAMSLRKDEFPTAIIYDEPHQYLRSAKLWKNAAVEARKYRLAYHWMFHSFNQIPRDLIQIIKDAGPHYYLYQTSQQTYKLLSEEISPFTLEDGMNTKSRHAICALRVGDHRMTPFMARMIKPVLNR